MEVVKFSQQTTEQPMRSAPDIGEAISRAGNVMSGLSKQVYSIAEDQNKQKEIQARLAQKAKEDHIKSEVSLYETMYKDRIAAQKKTIDGQWDKDKLGETIKTFNETEASRLEDNENLSKEAKEILRKTTLIIGSNEVAVYGGSQIDLSRVKSTIGNKETERQIALNSGNVPLADAISTDLFNTGYLNPEDYQTQLVSNRTMGEKAIVENQIYSTGNPDDLVIMSASLDAKTEDGTGYKNYPNLTLQARADMKAKVIARQTELMQTIQLPEEQRLNNAYRNGSMTHEEITASKASETFKAAMHDALDSKVAVQFVKMPTKVKDQLGKSLNALMSGKFFGTTPNVTEESIADIYTLLAKAKAPQEVYQQVNKIIFDGKASDNAGYFFNIKGNSVKYPSALAPHMEEFNNQYEALVSDLPESEKVNGYWNAYESFYENIIPEITLTGIVKNKRPPKDIMAEALKKAASERQYRDELKGAANTMRLGHSSQVGQYEARTLEKTGTLSPDLSIYNIPSTDENRRLMQDLIRTRKWSPEKAANYIKWLDNKGGK